MIMPRNNGLLLSSRHRILQHQRRRFGSYRNPVVHVKVDELGDGVELAVFGTDAISLIQQNQMLVLAHRRQPAQHKSSGRVIAVPDQKVAGLSQQTHRLLSRNRAVIPRLRLDVFGNQRHPIGGHKVLTMQIGGSSWLLWDRVGCARLVAASFRLRVVRVHLNRSDQRVQQNLDIFTREHVTPSVSAILVFCNVSEHVLGLGATLTLGAEGEEREGVSLDETVLFDDFDHFGGDVDVDGRVFLFHLANDPADNRIYISRRTLSNGCRHVLYAFSHNL